MHVKQKNVKNQMLQLFDRASDSDTDPDQCMKFQFMQLLIINTIISYAIKDTILTNCLHVYFNDIYNLRCDRDKIDGYLYTYSKFHERLVGPILRKHSNVVMLKGFVNSWLRIHSRIFENLNSAGAN